MRPMDATVVPSAEPAMAGDRRSSRNTPALTMVLEWRRAEVGVGAYIAPMSQDENGIWALLVRPGRIAWPAGPAVMRARSNPLGSFERSTSATENPSPPMRFMFRARNA